MALISEWIGDKERQRRERKQNKKDKRETYRENDREENGLGEISLFVKLLRGKSLF